MLAVAGTDVRVATATLDAHWSSQMSEEERVAANVVLDVEQDTMTCPACLTTFATGPRRCPECGLAFG